MKIQEVRGMSKFYSYDYPQLASERIDKALSEFPDMLHDIKPNIRKKFRDWYPENMHMVNAFIEVADLLRVEGKREYYSARAIFEHLRWNTLFKDTDSDFKVTDNVCAPLIRVIMCLEPRFQGMFQLRGNGKADNKVVEETEAE